MVSNRRDPRAALVRTLCHAAQSGMVSYGSLRLPCAIGRGGRRALKREGDGATPIGTWRFRQVFYRPDRLLPPCSAAPVRPLRPDMAWCDVNGDRNYNRLVRLPYPVLDERLWRDDHLYDVCVVLGYNDFPRTQGLGSAIFMHLAREGYGPTAGCIALSLPDILKLLGATPPPNAITIAD